MSVHPHLTATTSDDGAVQTITLTNPRERNAQTPSLWAALRHLVEAVPDTVRVVVLRAEGPDFSAGLHRGLLTAGGLPGEEDLLGVAARDRRAAEALIAGYQSAFTALSDLPQVVVAAVQGHAVGAGFQLALAADLRVLAEDARLALPEATLGLVPDLGGLTRLTALVGPAATLEVAATGRTIEAHEAVARGIASVAVPRAELEGTTDDLVAAVLAVPPPTLRALKHLVTTADARGSSLSGRAAQLADERAAQAQLIAGMAHAAGGLGQP